MKHVMLDLETVSLANNAALLSIGACEFTSGKVDRVFHVKMDWTTCLINGLDVDEATIDWWDTQDPEVKKSAFSGTMTCDQALHLFTLWLESIKGGEEVCIWGNGACSDNIWIKSAYASCNKTVPWSHRNDRCYRTAVAMLRPEESVQPTIAHDALCDAIAQAETLTRVLQLRGIPL